jgi:2-deoxy-D-gluconate 3-dehydrogenase
MSEAESRPSGTLDLFDLTGRVAVITGGNGGIGLGIARGLARSGAAVVIAGRNVEKSEKAAAELREYGATAIVDRVDLLDSTACKDLIDRAADRLGRLDILVNNAGISRRKPPQDHSESDWNEVLQTNLTAAFTCAQACYPHFLRAGAGKIINVGSMLSLFGSPFSVAYGVSKGGLLQMTKGLACAWAKDNIQTNAILPGWIDTDLSRGARRDIPSLNDRVLQRTPAGRWGTPEDFEGIAVFLASRASDFLNGAAIPVDGGYASVG